jgi:GTPase
VPKA